MLLLASSRQRPGMLENIPHRTGRPTTMKYPARNVNPANMRKSGSSRGKRKCPGDPGPLKVKATSRHEIQSHQKCFQHYISSLNSKIKQLSLRPCSRPRSMWRAGQTLQNDHITNDWGWRPHGCLLILICLSQRSGIFSDLLAHAYCGQT